jgi:hypothetical protein
MVDRIRELDAESSRHGSYRNILGDERQAINYNLGLTLRQEARERRIISQCETFH